jgi:S-adenosylmethionine hydrolase
MPRPVVSLLTDFGLRDPSAAIMKGVVLGIAPDAEVIDISHEVRKFRIRDGALLLWCALPYLPRGVHVAVVDPGVGTSRRPIALGVDRGDVLIGPDNGLLLMAADKLGGAVRAVELTEAAYRLPVISTSFHGRDIFAPAAAHLATGVPLERLGPAVDPDTLVRLPVPRPEHAPGELRAHVLYVDTFGSAKLTALADDLRRTPGWPRAGDRLEVTIDGHPIDIAWRATFGEAAVGEPLLYEDSYGRLSLAVNQGSAADRLGVREDQPVTIRQSRPRP